MSRRKSNWNEKLNKEIIEELEAHGYGLYNFSKYHLRVSNEESENTIDLWAGSGKCMQTGAHTVYLFGDWSGLNRFLKEVFEI